MNAIHPSEKTLFRLAFVLSALCWLGLVAGTFGTALLAAPLVWLAYAFAHSGFVSYVRGHGVRLSGEQLPEIYERFLECCQRVGTETIPEAYVMNGHGLVNALATRFLRRHYVVLFTEVLDALAERPESLDFYLGHELGHIQRGHLKWSWFLWPARFVPLLGAAYSRSREYTCDLHGLACCDVPKDAAYGLAVLAAGETTWEKLDLGAFASQSGETGGFWMSFHELVSDSPWLTKRMRYLLAASSGGSPRFPARHPLAVLTALLVPRLGGGAAAGAGGLLALVATVGVLAAVAIPNFLRFQVRARMAPVQELREQLEAAAGGYIAGTRHMPPSLEDLGLPGDLSNQAVAGVAIEGQSFRIALHPEIGGGAGGQIALTPYYEGEILRWRCEGDLDPELLAVACAERARPAPASAADGLRTGAGATARPRVVPHEITCRAGFRESPDYAALSGVERDRLREGCNLWKLEQLERRSRAAGS